MCAKIWPSKKQWQNWTLPSRLTAIGVLVGLIALGLYLFEKGLHVSGSMLRYSRTTCSLERDFPVRFGFSRDRVAKRLGSPQISTALWDSFYAYGMMVYYDRHAQSVDGFYISRQESGVVFGGTVCGVKIGDQASRAVTLLGAPSHWALPSGTHSLAIWKRSGRFVAMAIRRGVSEGHLDNRIMGTVESITYCHEKSFAYYMPIVALSMQELRGGVVPTYLEGEFAVWMDPNDLCFQKPYRMIDLRLSPFGGATCLLQFLGSKRFGVWIYPLAGVEPRIRAIFELDEDGEPILPQGMGETPQEGPGGQPLKYKIGR